MQKLWMLCLLFAAGSCISCKSTPEKQVFMTPSKVPVELKYSQQAIQSKWEQRIQGFLNKNVIPLIDLQSSIRREQAEDYIEDSLPVMDELGVALIAFDGYQVPRESKKQRGYRWSYYIHQLVNAYPERFILATNGGTNKNWLREKDSFIEQLEDQVNSGVYSIMGELDFRHYMSGHQCRDGKTDRDNDISLTSDNGHRVFELSAVSGVPFIIHLEAEDTPLTELEVMLKAFPEARIIVAHFGQIRHPEKQTKWGPQLAERLLQSYPNLYYDISVGRPGRTYKCNDEVLDTVIWQDDGFGGQKNILKPEYKAIFEKFSDRFVVGLDYGGGRDPLDDYLVNKVRVRRLIMRDLSEQAKHNIGYRNAWRLLTGNDWQV
jgi:predicted TIM-barrel fold metal-dependent hydrolase